MIVDYHKLSQEAVNGLIEAFILQEGTDYGEIEMEFSDKKIQIKRQLEQGEALIVFDEKTETASILPSKQLKLILNKDTVQAVGF